MADLIKKLVISIETIIIILTVSVIKFNLRLGLIDVKQSDSLEILLTIVQAIVSFF